MLDKNNNFIVEEIKGYECDLENPFAFISYAHDINDSAIVREIFFKLYRLGYNLWADMANLPHDRNSWEKAADKALLHNNNTCKLIFFFRSENSLVRPTVLRELSTFTALGDRCDNIVVIDIRKDVEISDLDILYNRFLDSLEGDDQKCCSDIFELVSTSCSAIRLHEDADDNIDKLVDLMAAECVKHHILQHFKIHDKINDILSGAFSIKLKPDQEQAFNIFAKLLDKMNSKSEKSVILVKGKPGTGKTSLAMKMLMYALDNNIAVNYVTKSAAIRNAYSQGTYGSNRMSAEVIFRGSGTYYDAPANSVDLIIVDEAQLLDLKSGMFSNLGENQTAEILNAARLVVFILDDNQKISLRNHGSVAEIESCVRKIDPYGDNYYPFELATQTRCRGADSYIELVDSILNIGGHYFGRVIKTSPYSLTVCSSAKEMYDRVMEHQNNNESARILAGYCWNWNKDGRDDESCHDIVIDDLAISWNTLSQISGQIDLDKETGNVLPVYMAQGLEFDYIGVIIGPDLKYRDYELIVDFDAHAATDRSSFTGYKAAMKSGDPIVIENMKKSVDMLIRNIYRILLTRGLKGCYVYCVDDALNEYFKNRVDRYEQSEML